ncbi:MAG: prolyl oligopeptidase family serine peptidase [Phycisphaerales bacterium]|nr:prolyl oligopeptidase family serine peptidase [Phycisphaerales bacterium]
MLALLTLLLAAPSGPPTLKQIMQDPDWMALAPRQAWWSDDGQEIFFRRDRPDGVTDEIVRLDPATGGQSVLTDAERTTINRPGGDWDTARTRRVHTHDGDLFLSDVTTGQVIRLTNTATSEYRPRFMAGDESIQFQRHGRTVVRNLATGAEFEPRWIVFQDEEEDDKKDTSDFMTDQQQRLFETLRKREEQSDTREAWSDAIDEADPRRRPEDVRLGSGRNARLIEFSPAGRWLILSTGSGRRSGEQDTMPRFVTDSGYVGTQRVRSMVGVPKRTTETLLLVDLDSGTFHKLDHSVLPTIRTDPLAWLDQDAAANDNATAAPEADNQNATEDGPTRAIRYTALEWSPDGERLVIQARSQDNKDRWIAEVDLASDPPSLEPIHHLYDEAWIGRSFNGMDWMNDGSALWFQSEESGWGHVYAWDPETDEVTALTNGPWEARSVREGPGDGLLWFTTGRERPVVRDVHVVDPATGEIRQVTSLDRSVDSFSLSPAGDRLLMRVSSATHPPEIVIQDVQADGAPHWLTESRTPEYLSTPLVEPRIVRIPSPHGADLWAKLYLPPDPADGPRPAVVFIHGAGYLQNADNQWSNYAREALFNMHLARQGYVVLDLDYRASSGYGRDFRAAIYRNMGTPEVEDLAVAIDWLATNHDVDPARVGAYGGSYGGFVVLMAMFTEPGLLACGAALRPVTDWAHYNDSYTRPILNTPERDPEAYRVSSPIEHAEGLDGALLICHGMVDDNVLFKDSVRLAQRLIELEKVDWEVAMYPVEPHGFREDSSWLDEYRRIDELFRENLLED